MSGLLNIPEPMRMHSIVSIRGRHACRVLIREGDHAAALAAVYAIRGTIGGMPGC